MEGLGLTPVQKNDGDGLDSDCDVVFTAISKTILNHCSAGYNS